MILISQLPEHWQKWYKKWDSHVPKHDNKLRLQGELLGEPGSQQSYSAAFELFLFSTFNDLGLCVDFQPEINGVNPDFGISDVRGCKAYVEAGAMFSNPLEMEQSYDSMKTDIFEEFKKLQSQDFTVQQASSSGHPGNVSPKLVRREVQKWIDQLNPAEVGKEYRYNILPARTFQFKNWRLDVSLVLKSPEDKGRLGKTAVESAGFSGGWGDFPAKRLKNKLKEKFSQVRKTKSHCIVAITEAHEGFSVDDVQAALLGGNSEYDMYFGNEIANSHPYIKGLYIPQPNTDGLWNLHDAKEPIAVIIHRGDLRYPKVESQEVV